MGSSSYAMILCASEFLKLEKFPRVKEDISNIATLLKSSEVGGYNVDIIDDLSSSEVVISRVDEFFSNKNEDDLVVFYYCGHGVLDKVNNDLFLAFKDTDPESPAAISLPASHLTEKIINCSARRKVVVLDCCYAGKMVVKRRIEQGGGVDQISNEGEVCLLAASNGDRSAVAVDGKPVFTSSILELIRNGGNVSSDRKFVTVGDVSNCSKEYLRLKGAGDDDLSYSNFSDVGSRIELFRNVNYKKKNPNEKVLEEIDRLKIGLLAGRARGKPDIGRAFRYAMLCDSIKIDINEIYSFLDSVKNDRNEPDLSAAIDEIKTLYGFKSGIRETQESAKRAEDRYQMTLFFSFATLSMLILSIVIMGLTLKH